MVLNNQPENFQPKKANTLKEKVKNIFNHEEKYYTKAEYLEIITRKEIPRRIYEEIYDEACTEWKQKTDPDTLKGVGPDNLIKVLQFVIIGINVITFVILLFKM